MKFHLLIADSIIIYAITIISFQLVDYLMIKLEIVSIKNFRIFTAINYQ